jgi:hypothetical protein
MVTMAATAMMTVVTAATATAVTAVVTGGQVKVATVAAPAAVLALAAAATLRAPVTTYGRGNRTGYLIFSRAREQQLRPTSGAEG